MFRYSQVDSCNGAAPDLTAISPTALLTSNCMIYSEMTRCYAAPPITHLTFNLPNMKPGSVVVGNMLFFCAPAVPQFDHQQLLIWS